MAIAEVGGGTQRATVSASSVDSATVAFPGNVTAGNLLTVEFGGWSNPADTSVGFNDTRSTSYGSLLASTGVAWAGGVGKSAIGYGIAPSSGACTVTIDPDGTGNYFNAVIDEFSGVDTATPLDVDGGETTGTVTIAGSVGDSLTTVTDNDLVLGVAVFANTFSTATVQAGYTEIDRTTSTAVQVYLASFGIVTTAGSYTPGWDVEAGSLAWSAISAAFKPAGGAAVDASMWHTPIFRPRLRRY